MQSIIERCQVGYRVLSSTRIIDFFSFRRLQHSLRMWCEEYIRRIDASVGNKFRH